jgi:sigma-B regulation protein RsbU (phosphoserine phosphatase)
VPITRASDDTLIGGLAVARSAERGPIEQVLPVAQSLAALIASALVRADMHREMLIHARTVQELEIAGDIQATFLPNIPPELEGWSAAALVSSARETSGDFFDTVTTWDGRLALVVADVADKGLGAALYMALSRTLLRTYITEYSTRYPDSYAFHPERVLNTVNKCIVEDTRSDLFVTTFLGIIDPALFSLTYANAGHNPPLLFTHDGQLRRLTRTGIPIGVLPDSHWERGSVRMEPGDLLVAYTDGLTDAESATREPFGEARLIEAVRQHIDLPVRDLRDRVVEAARDFMDGTPQPDDITLLIVRHELPEPP